MNPKKPLAAKRAPTSLDVAKAAGVSRTTVSYVLNDTPGLAILPKTRERVWQAARRLHYHTNSSARALSKGYSNEICFFAAEPAYSPVVAQHTFLIQERARQLGYNVVTYAYPSHSAPEAWRALLGDVLARHPAGIIGNSFVITKGTYRLAKSMGVKGCALVGPGPSGYAPTIALPYEAAGFIAGTHLNSRGHVRVGCIIPTAMDAMRQANLASGLAGLKAGLGAIGEQIIQVVMDADLPSARQAVDRLLGAPNRPTAIFGLRDAYCFPLMRALLERGLHIPGDIAVIGSDDTALCSLVFPSLTSVHMDMVATSYQLIDIIDCQVHGREIPPELLVLPPPQLVVREST